MIEALSARQVKVLEFLEEVKSADLEMICSKLHISESTARRILSTLDEKKLIQRYRGGAMIAASENDHEPPVVCRSRKMEAEKDAIARVACEYIHDGDTILLTAGTTISRMCSYMEHFRNLTVLTDSLLVSRELSRCGGIRLFMLGGLIDPDEQCTYGFLTQENIERFKVDTLFVSSRALDPKLGLLTDDMQHMLLYKQYLLHTDKVIALMDHSKLFTSGTGILYQKSDIDLLLIDDQAPADAIRAFTAERPTVRLCPVKGE